MAAVTLLPNSGKFYETTSYPPQKDVQFQHLWKVMDDIKQAVLDGSISVQQATSLLSGYVQSVTGPDVDNTDPQNPIINPLSPLLLMGA